MKKLIVTTLATTAMALGVFAQGSIGGIQTMFNADGITTPGANATDPNLATTWYTGNITLELLYAASGSVTSGQIAAINALDGTSGGGAAAWTLAMSDGFSLVSATSLTGSTAGSLAYVVSDGGLQTASNPNTIGLLAPAATSANAWIAMYATGSGGAFNGYSGMLAFTQNTGGNPTTIPPGTQAVMTKDPTGQNLVLTTVVPEPTTLALAALGGVSMLLIRRKK